MKITTHYPYNNCTKFEWLINSHIEVEDKGSKKILNDIFITLNGDLDGLVSKRRSKLRADAYFDSLDVILEIDEIQHFTEYRMQTLEILKNIKDIKLGYNIENYINNCRNNYITALKKGQVGYRKPTPEFPFEYGRALQRAYFDTIRDILVPKFLGKPVLRISEIEINQLGSNQEIKEHIKNRLQNLL